MLKRNIKHKTVMKIFFFIAKCLLREINLRYTTYTKKNDTLYHDNVKTILVKSICAGRILPRLDDKNTIYY